MEFDRDPKINIQELISTKRETMKKEQQVRIIEIEASEYMKMKQRMKDLEVQNALLQSQVKILKSEAIQRIGTVREVHKQLFRQKLDQLY